MLRTIIRRFLNRFGYEVVKLESLNGFDIGRWIDRLDIGVVIDVGANEGQFVKSISRFIPNPRFYSFEPIKKCYDELVKNTAGFNVKSYNCGLSNVNGTTEINISANFVSSSILPMEELHEELYPSSKYINKQTIQLRRLDDVAAEMDLNSNFLLKIDVQGYEDKVIEGGKATIARAAVVIIEYSYQPVYEGQWLFDTTYRYFADNGFKFVGMAEQVSSTKTGVPIYGDAMFVRKDLAARIYQ